MITLPHVTLVMIDTLTHDLARLAVNDCVRSVQFADVLICTDQWSRFDSLDCAARFEYAPRWPDKLGWSRYSWFHMPKYVHTSHALTIQWDSWVWNSDRWDDEFLAYDIVGAPWDWHSEYKVGNLGFGLRSSRLMRYVSERADDFPCTTDADDALLCRTYRPALEAAGFKWAPPSVARRFAFECTPPAAGETTFGFHGAFNFHRVLSLERFTERQRLMESQ